MSLVQWIELPRIADERGSLVAIEEMINIPFEIKRIYYIFGTKEGFSRGFHAHKSLKQVAICVSGRCKMILDNGRERAEVWLESPAKGLLINHMIWREMHDFSPNCVLLVVANEHYNEADYIQNYESFLKNVTE